MRGHLRRPRQGRGPQSSLYSGCQPFTVARHDGWPSLRLEVAPSCSEGAIQRDLLSEKYAAGRGRPGPTDARISSAPGRAVTLFTIPAQQLECCRKALAASLRENSAAHRTPCHETPVSQAGLALAPVPPAPVLQSGRQPSDLDAAAERQRTARSVRRARRRTSEPRPAARPVRARTRSTAWVAAGTGPAARPEDGLGQPPATGSQRRTVRFTGRPDRLGRQ